MARAAAEGARGRDPLRRRVGDRLARLVGKAPDRPDIGDVKPARAHGHPVGPLEARCEDGPDLGYPVAVSVAQEGDAARSRLGDEDIAIWRHLEPERLTRGTALVGRRITRAPGGVGRREILDPDLEPLSRRLVVRMGRPGNRHHGGGDCQNEGGRCGNAVDHGSIMHHQGGVWEVRHGACGPSADIPPGECINGLIMNSGQTPLGAPVLSGSRVRCAQISTAFPILGTGAEELAGRWRKS